MSVALLKKENFFADGENMHIQLSKDRPDYIGVLHSHEYIEVIYIISGNATHRVSDKTYEVQRGDLFIVNPRTVHAFYAKPNSDKPFVAYDLMFTPEFFDSAIDGYHPLEALSNSFILLSLFVEYDTPKPYLSLTDTQYTVFGELFNKIYLEYQHKKKGYREIIRAYLIELIVTCLRLNEKQPYTSAEIRNHRIVEFLTDFIKDNYALPLSASLLAKKVFLNPDYLGRVFKNKTGLSITDTIQKIRIEKACELLANSKKSIAEIAHLCGFKDTKFFYTVFKKQIGTVPSAYRKALKTK